MKAIKKVLFITMAAVLVFAAVAFAGCGRGEGKSVQSNVPESFEGKVTIVIDDPDTEKADVYFQVDFVNGELKAIDVINQLKNDGKICYKGSDSQYGMFLTAVGIVENGEDKYLIQADDSKNVFIAFYTNVAIDMGGGTGIKYGEETVESSLQGVSSMSLKDGAIIFITEGTY